MPYAIKSLKLVLPVFCLCALAMCIGHLVLVKSDKARLNHFTQQTFNRTQQVYNDATSLLSQSTETTTLCSSIDLNALRNTLWNRKLIKDVGRIDDNNRIICSANWGKLANPIQLPIPSMTWPDKTKHWDNIPDTLYGRDEQASMLAHNNTLVLISPYDFEIDTSETTNINAVIVSSDLEHVFRSIGKNMKTKGLLQSKNAVGINAVSNRTCDKKTKFCVIGRIDSVGFFGLSDKMKFAFIIICLMIGSLTAWLLFKIKSHRQSMLYSLKKAINNDCLYLEFQPKFALLSKQVIGFEALVRWQDKYFGKVPPDVFIELAEKSRLIKKLTRVVIRKTLEDLSPLLQRYPRLSVSINLSMEDITDKSLLPFINQQVDSYGLMHKQFIFEITERSIIGFDDIAPAIKRFTKSNYQISLDDFGTGYANLSWLGKLNAQEIKIDKLFTQSIGTDSINSRTLNAIFVLLRELDVNMVFEGIETQEQADFIRSRFQNAIGQGWLFAHAMPIKQLEDYLHELKKEKSALTNA